MLARRDGRWRFAEAAGLESVWAADHLVASGPLLDSTVVLATAAAATHRVRVGYGVLLLAMRPVTWAARQVGARSRRRFRVIAAVARATRLHWSDFSLPSTFAASPRVVAGSGDGTAGTRAERIDRWPPNPVRSCRGSRPRSGPHWL
ncbi:LLM class flavin-dependent oxidoreductase [Nocardia amikacinitolerans]|uniref:LLM class flavin-dependent oxidoreductase n=1 Tax=Nocardia amikacinitolerans TaxID=756689 RepID=UPI0036837458